jgi:hypothetical protein
VNHAERTKANNQAIKPTNACQCISIEATTASTEHSNTYDNSRTHSGFSAFQNTENPESQYFQNTENTESQYFQNPENPESQYFVRAMKACSAAPAAQRKVVPSGSSRTLLSTQFAVGDLAQVM